MKKKIILSFTAIVTVFSIFSAIASASSNQQNISAEENIGIEIARKVNNQIQYTEYTSINAFEGELKNFVNNTMLVKPIDQYTKQEQDQWNKLYNTLQTVMAPVSSNQVSTRSLTDIYNNIQQGIEATMTTTIYGAAVASGVLYSTNQANDEQKVYMNQHGFTTTQENEVDAFRHFSWNYHMTDNILITRSKANWIADNHEFSAHGARYGYNNWPNAANSYQVAQGIYYTNKIKNEVDASSDIATFKTYFVNSNFMDFNNNEAGRAYESKGYSNNFTAFAAAKLAGHVTVKPSEWNATYLAQRAFSIYKKEVSY
ncbi:DUF6973 domain-containing protein [Paenibacillus marinisediminis]